MFTLCYSHSLSAWPRTGIGLARCSAKGSTTQKHWAPRLPCSERRMQSAVLQFKLVWKLIDGICVHFTCSTSRAPQVSELLRKPEGSNDSPQKCQMHESADTPSCFSYIAGTSPPCPNVRFFTFLAAPSQIGRVLGQSGKKIVPGTQVTKAVSLSFTSEMVVYSVSRVRNSIRFQ